MLQVGAVQTSVTPQARSSKNLSIVDPSGQGYGCSLPADGAVGSVRMLGLREN